MDVLCIIPPHIPSYFNAGHHLAVFQVAAFLRRNTTESKVYALDAAALNITWKEICDLLVKKPKLIALMNDFDGIDTFQRFLTYVKKFTPASKIITFGRLSNQIPKFFLQYKIDAIHFSGDYEDGVFSYWKYINNQQSDCPGVLLQTSPDKEAAPGRYLDPNEWVLPDINDIPYTAYNKMYMNDLNKFCGIPARQELVIPVARGCPIGCFYCDVPKMQGKYERRLSVEETINYITDSFKQLPFEYISFYSPTFTLNKLWVMALCDKFLELNRSYPWKCTTALSCLSEDLIIKMGKAGCVRISLGIETMTGAAKNLPKTKQDVQDQLFSVIETCKKTNIELNAFIMLGLPGDNPEAVQQTIKFCIENGIRVRPTIYTPYHEMKDNLLPHEVATYNRQSFIDDLLPDDVTEKYYNIFYNNKDDKPTAVMNKVKKCSSGLPTTLS
jgi:radical SAM superfamily enzyme YgiQ (UPF0313 family)